jgi:hypothetical protein
LAFAIVMHKNRMRENSILLLQFPSAESIGRALVNSRDSRCFCLSFVPSALSSRMSHS